MAGVQFCIAETSRDTTTMRDEEPGQRQKGKSRHSEQHERFGDCTSSTQLWQEDRGSDGMERGRIWQHLRLKGTVRVRPSRMSSSLTLDTTCQPAMFYGSRRPPDKP